MKVLGGHVQQLLFDVHHGGANSGRFGGDRLAPPAGVRILGGPGIGIFDLNHVCLYSQLFGDHHGHNRLGPRADVAGPHVQVHAAVGI